MNIMISFLPEEIIQYIIKPYLSLEDIYLTNKTDYIVHKTEKFTSLYEQKKQRFSNSYITYLIRNDYSLVFEILINIMFKHWYKSWKIKYKEGVFSCYIDLLNYKCIEYRANLCRNIINCKLQKKGNHKNKFKRIRIRKHKWNN